jgi:hypothetical protein
MSVGETVCMASNDKALQNLSELQGKFDRIDWAYQSSWT